MQVGAVVEDRGERRRARRAAEVARQIVEARGVLHALGRQRAERDVVDRDRSRASGRRRGRPAARTAPRNPSPWSDRSSTRCRAAKNRKPAISMKRGSTLAISRPAIGAVRNMATPGDEHGLADHQRVVAADLRQIERVEIGEAVEADAEHEREQAAERRSCGRAKARRSTIGCCAVSTRTKKTIAERPDTQASSSTRVVAEPVVARALLEHVLERAEEAGHRRAGPIQSKLSEQRPVGLVEVDQRRAPRR